MAESFKSKRVRFIRPGGQRSFILRAKERITASDRELSKILNINERTLRDWTKEKFSISLDAASKLSKLSSTPLHKSILITNLNDHLKNISSEGGIAKYKKYKQVGSKSEREKKWKAWWEAEGKHRDIPHMTKKSILQPKKSEDLAEYVGIMIGDGGISDYFTTVTLNSKDDSEYAKHVARLIRKLFGVTPKAYASKNYQVLNVVTHRKALVEYCESIGLKRGNKLKSGLLIPNWILKDRSYRIACIRGLFDTDGSVFSHRYNSKGKTYSYKRISFSSASPNLVRLVANILKNLEINVRITRDQKEARIESKMGVERYFLLIGTNNPKHKRKYTKEE